MIYVRIEMWPKGDMSCARLLGEAKLCNEGGTNQVADYSVVLLKSPEYARAGNVGKAWKRGEVKGFKRLKLGHWDLLFRALAATVGYRNREAT